jgi:hypothetical protein
VEFPFSLTVTSLLGIKEIWPVLGGYQKTGTYLEVIRAASFKLTSVFAYLGLSLHSIDFAKIKESILKYP